MGRVGHRTLTPGLLPALRCGRQGPCPDESVNRPDLCWHPSNPRQGRGAARHGASPGSRDSFCSRAACSDPAWAARRQPRAPHLRRAEALVASLRAQSHPFHAATLAPRVAGQGGGESLPQGTTPAKRGGCPRSPLTGAGLASFYSQCERRSPSTVPLVLEWRQKAGGCLPCHMPDFFC